MDPGLPYGGMDITRRIDRYSTGTHTQDDQTFFTNVLSKYGVGVGMLTVTSFPFCQCVNCGNVASLEDPNDVKTHSVFVIQNKSRPGVLDCVGIWSESHESITELMKLDKSFGSVEFAKSNGYMLYWKCLSKSRYSGSIFDIVSDMKLKVNDYFKHCFVPWSGICDDCIDHYLQKGIMVRRE